MKAKQIVYKATFKGVSWCHWLGFRKPEMVLWYFLGRKTVPVFGKILTFSNKEDLVDFVHDEAREFDEIIVFEGIGTNAEAIKIMSCNHEDYGFKFWKVRKAKKRLNNTMSAPKGTIGVDSFTPTKQYTWNEWIEETIKLS